MDIFRFIYATITFDNCLQCFFSTEWSSIKTICEVRERIDLHISYWYIMEGVYIYISVFRGLVESEA